ncbi:MAG: leucine-rich repeat domain-containing protein, partial [Clostridia bacterium]|nr:leucine-rich repeat domain-containing protein [Clostridia bacterium]
FGKNLSFIDKYVFDYLPRDRNIYFDNESAYEFYNGVVYNKKTSTAMFGIGTDYTNEIKIKDGTKIIADHFYVDAFTRWRKKTHNDASQWYNGNIIIPEGVEIIGALAFYDCRISGLSLPSTLKKIGNCAFSGNYLKRLWLYNSITEIGEYAFSNSVNDETEIHFQDNTFYDGKNFMINNTLIYTKQ